LLTLFQMQAIPPFAAILHGNNIENAPPIHTNLQADLAHEPFCNHWVVHIYETSSMECLGCKQSMYLSLLYLSSCFINVADSETPSSERFA
jgi:hypothetical protein